jgi:hypothetical protein
VICPESMVAISHGASIDGQTQACSSRIIDSAEFHTKPLPSARALYGDLQIMRRETDDNIASRDTQAVACRTAIVVEHSYCLSGFDIDSDDSDFDYVAALEEKAQRRRIMAFRKITETVC